MLSSFKSRSRILRMRKTNFHALHQSATGLGLLESWQEGCDYDVACITGMVQVP